MKGNSIKFFSALIITLFSVQAVAQENSIRVTVKTNESTAYGIGYKVDGKNLGTIGKVYTGKGIKNKEHIFGYRKNSFYGTNILCGSMTLTKDTTVILATKGDKCQMVLVE